MSPVSKETMPESVTVVEYSVVVPSVRVICSLIISCWTEHGEFLLSTRTVTLLVGPLPLPVVASNRTCQLPAPMLRVVSVRFQVAPVLSSTFVAVLEPALSLNDSLSPSPHAAPSAVRKYQVSGLASKARPIRRIARASARRKAATRASQPGCLAMRRLIS